MAARIKALEDQMKLGQIDQGTFEQLRDQITGGSINATHLVKGLDRQLLARIRRGEDVLGGDGSGKEGDAEPTVNADEEFEALELKDVAPLEREKTNKKGEMAPPPLPVAGQKRSRNDILAEFKAARKAAEEAAAAAQPQLGSRFKKIDQKKPGSRIERDEKGREVLITVDEHGNVKRKYRKEPAADKQAKPAMPMPDKALKPLGMDVPVIPAAPTPPEDLDDDIFAGVGDSYDPLGAAQDDDDEDDSDADKDKEETTSAQPNGEASRPRSAPPDTIPLAEIATSPPLATPEPVSEATTSVSQPAKRNNYFTNTSNTETKVVPGAPFSDPTILETIKRAAALAKASAPDDVEGADKAPSTAAQRLMAREQNNRDYEDMDLEFGSSRAGDEEDAEEGGKRVKLSEWKGGVGEDDDDEEAGKGRGGKERKRGKKKRKGDKDSAADVLKVIAGRKDAAGR